MPDIVASMLIDSHVHLDAYADDAERAAVLDRAAAAGVSTLLAIGIGDGPDTMQRALEYALAPEREGGPRIFASAGIHPQEAASATPVALAKLMMLAAEPRCIAIGEIGLDYYHVGNPDILTQKTAFLAQMRVAAGAGKPILIHCRTSELATAEAKQKFGDADAWEDLLELVEMHWTRRGLGGVMHCFSGTPEQAERSVAAGFYLSFAGNLTYPKSAMIREAAMRAPADRILVETDAPFLAPVPHRGRQNEPALMTHTAAALAELRGLTVEELAALTTRNFETLFASTRG